MDTDAARRARRKALKPLDAVYTDEEASPPEWVDLLNDAREQSKVIAESIDRETEAFIADPDIRNALARRERFAFTTRERVGKLNEKIRRLNLIAPNSRFTRGTLDADELLLPLFRSKRNVSS